MDALIRRQKQLGEYIENKITLYGKDPQDRRNKEKSKERLQKLTETWHEFLENDTKLSLIPEIENTPYRKNNYYDIIQNTYQKVILILQTRINPNTGAIPKNISSSARDPTPNVQNQSTSEERTGDYKTELTNTYTARYNRVITTVKLIRGSMDRLNLMMLIERKIVQLDEQMSSFREVVDKIEANKINVQNLATGNKELEDYYDDCIIDLYEKLQQIQERNTQAHTHAKINIKPIEIPQFHGEYKDWPSYNNLFSNAIINNERLNNTEKMQYLKTTLRGKAADAISHLKILEENFEPAWNILKERFSNRRLQIYSQVENILDLQNISSEDPNAMIKFHDLVKDCLQALNAMAINTDNWDVWLIPILAKKNGQHTTQRI